MAKNSKPWELPPTVYADSGSIFGTFDQIRARFLPTNETDAAVNGVLLKSVPGREYPKENSLNLMKEAS
jgi:hypothetical protein